MKLNIDWTKVDSCYKYAAMDASGEVFLYEELPDPLHLIWDSCVEGKVVRLMFLSNLENLVENLSASWGALDWKETLTERPTEEIKMSTPNKVHPHTAIIAEAIKDTSRKIEGRQKAREKWIELGLEDVVNEPENWEFRFADTAPTVTSPLTDDELLAVWTQTGTATNHAERMRDLKRVAIAAKVATIRKVADISFNMPLPERNDGGFDPENMIHFAAATVAEFRVQMLKLIGE